MFRLTAVAALATVASCLAPATAHAIPSDYTISRSSGPAGTTITVASKTPCPTPPPGTAAPSVLVSLANAPVLVDGGSTTTVVNADRSWSTSITVKDSARNGLYHVVAGCFAANGTLSQKYEGQDFVVTSPPGQPDPVVRIAGSDRIETAIAAADDTFGESLVPPAAVVLARSDSYADALAGTPFARAKGGPLLLTGSDALDARTATEIRQLLGASGDVFILGGTTAISDDVVSALTSAGYTVTRVAGANRFDTAVKVATAIGSPTSLLLATGMDFRDGLVAGTAAAAVPSSSVVLLTNDAVMPSETKAYIDGHGAITRYAVGARAAAADPSATAIVGTDDADTSRKVAETFFVAPITVAVASAAAFPDALSGGVHAAFQGAPLLLTQPDVLPSSVTNYLINNQTTTVCALVYGGTVAVSDIVRTAVVLAIT